jgi:ubiquitin carboxyl-terminal hydrolase 8
MFLELLIENIHSIYYSIKMNFLLWCYLPQIQGTKILYSCIFKNILQHNTYNIINENINDYKSINKEEDYIPIGLQNLGATCFMNAVLQNFNNIKPFREYLYTGKYLNNPKINNCPITKAFTTVIRNLSNSQLQSYTPYEFKQTIGKYNSEFLSNRPNDSRELIQYLLESLHEELNENIGKEYEKEDNYLDTDWENKLNFEKDSFNYENKSIISDLFYGIQGTEIKCSNCQNLSYVFEHFSIVSLPMIRINKNEIDIKNMFEDYEDKIEMKGKNKYYCSICENEYDAYSQTFFYETPEILIIHPVRSNKGITYSANLKFNEVINFSPYLSQNIKNKKIFYNLIGIIYHYGTSGYGGHNIAYCKIQSNQWYEFNDSNTSKVQYFTDIKGEGVILLFYQKSN